MKKESVDAIVVHCSATKPSWDCKVADIDKMHKERGFKMIGYHYVIDLDGTVERGRPTTMNGAHCNTKGFSSSAYNKHSIGICYVGGLDDRGNPADTRTDAQKTALHDLVMKLLQEYPNIKEVLGHRDTSPDLNHDGRITKNEWIKTCPCFDVKAEFPIAICTAKRK